MKAIIGSGKVSNIIKEDSDVVFSHREIEIKDIESVRKCLSSIPKGTTVINTAAKINLEWCEENEDECYEVNVVGALNVAKVCRDLGLHLFHLSSGCIFDGMETGRAYDENDKPNPSAWYTKCKAQADDLIMNLGYEKITIGRPRQLVSSVPNPTNMLTKFASLKSGNFIDVPNSMTCIEDMKDMINHLIEGNHYGIFNLANSGTVTPYKIAKRVKRTISPDLEVKKIDYSSYLKTLKVKRVNTILSLEKITSTGYIPRNSEVALDWCLENYGK